MKCHLLQHRIIGSPLVLLHSWKIRFLVPPTWLFYWRTPAPIVVPYLRRPFVRGFGLLSSFKARMVRCIVKLHRVTAHWPRFCKDEYNASNTTFNAFAMPCFLFFFLSRSLSSVVSVIRFYKLEAVPFSRRAGVHREGFARGFDCWSIVSFRRSKSRSVDHGFTTPFDLDSLRNKVEGRFESVDKLSKGEWFEHRIM